MSTLPKILIIDDDASFLEKIRFDLSQHFICETSNQPEKYFESTELCKDFDAIIIDLHMPRTDGLNLCLEIKRQLRNAMPLFILSQDTSEQARLAGLRLGVEDFLNKTMSIEEITLRITNRIATALLSFENLSYNARTNLYTLGAQHISLTPVEGAILKEILASGQVSLKRDDLVKAIWKNRKVVEHTLNSHVHNLNKKLENWPRLIRIEKDGNIQLQPREGLKKESLNQPSFS